MAIVAKGTPKVQLPSEAPCLDEDVSSVPDVCAPCRQLDRWTSQTLAWARSKASRLQALIASILKGHDDVLQSLCGFCFSKTTLTCECEVAAHQLEGHSLDIQILIGGDVCLQVGSEITLNVCGTDECWFVSCERQVCETCLTLTLDPCNNADHLTIFNQIRAVNFIKNTQRPTGPALLEAAEALFPGSTPSIVATAPGEVWLSLGRDLTAAELQLREYFVSILPVPVGVDVTLVNSCA